MATCDVFTLDELCYFIMTRAMLFVVVFFATFCGGSGEFTVTSPEPSIDTAKGENITLECRFSGNYVKSSVLWAIGGVAYRKYLYFTFSFYDQLYIICIYHSNIFIRDSSRIAVCVYLFEITKNIGIQTVPLSHIKKLLLFCQNYFL